MTEGTLGAEGGIESTGRQSQRHPEPAAGEPRLPSKRPELLSAGASPTRQGLPAPADPQLFFNGRCEEALDFYRQALGAEVTALVRFQEGRDSPPAGSMPTDWGRKVMRAAFRVGGTALTASDGRGEPEALSLSLVLPDAASVDKAFHALADGGQVLMAPTRTYWSPRFGMLTDRFGIGWMVLSRWIEGRPAQGKSCRRLHGMSASQ